MEPQLKLARVVQAASFLVLIIFLVGIFATMGDPRFPPMFSMGSTIMLFVCMVANMQVRIIRHMSKLPSKG